MFGVKRQSMIATANGNISAGYDSYRCDVAVSCAGIRENQNALICSRIQKVTAFIQHDVISPIQERIGTFYRTRRRDITVCTKCIIKDSNVI